MQDNNYSLESILNVMRNAEKIFKSESSKNIANSFTNLILTSDFSLEIKSNILRGLSLMLVTFEHSEHEYLILEILSKFFNSSLFKKNQEFFRSAKISFCENIFISTKRKSLKSKNKKEQYLLLVENLFIHNLLFKDILESIQKTLKLKNFYLNFLFYMECKYLGYNYNCIKCWENLQSDNLLTVSNICINYLNFISMCHFDPEKVPKEKRKDDFVIYNILGEDCYKNLKYFNLHNIEFYIPLIENNLLFIMHKQKEDNDLIWNKENVGNNKLWKKKIINFLSKNESERSIPVDNKEKLFDSFTKEICCVGFKNYQNSLKEIHKRIFQNIYEYNLKTKEFFSTFFLYFVYHFQYFKDLPFGKRLQFFTFLVKNVKSLNLYLKKLSFKMLMITIPHEPEIIFENLLIKQVFNPKNNFSPSKHHILKVCRVIAANNKKKLKLKNINTEMNIDQNNLKSVLSLMYNNSIANENIQNLIKIEEIKDMLLNCFCKNSYLLKNYYNLNEESLFEQDNMNQFLMTKDNASVNTMDTFKNTTKSTFEKLYFRSNLCLIFRI